ncbi:sulfate adenylyltransferase [Endozoicomonas montiporae]|uniref:Sulfate adenylyltransferase subunit 1 n=2 Tax=Endozoicomonas montiporae TaxID=1027273 RepID=A0A081N2T5_9GAMM|nr:sulfate adenylyltransferase subunit CysN [Endozoicomonas montiporae]AMO58025.1 sulfate adenylate transferase GTPase subunit 1 [Endozoicomonas montiporae CL-33]KEQ12758.1 sulfate adenylyltransferase [Endozoicomonas montiporae]
MSHQSDLIARDIEEYLRRHEQKEILRFLTCGSVDDGKSTLIGRLLHDTSMIYEDQLASVQSDSKRVGTQGEKIDLALLVDGLQAEREQGITIDVAYRYFSTEKRKYIIADTPGHEQYTRNMATGASTCDLAIILVDARQGVLTQTRRHTYIANLLGIRHLVVAVNKMDLVDYSEARFTEIRNEYLGFAESLNLGDVRFVPISALEGDNVVERRANLPWYSGQTLMEMLESVEVADDRNLDDFRLPVQYVNRPNLDFRGYAGTIASGVIQVGDSVKVLPSGRESTVSGIVTYDGDLSEAFAGQAVTLILKDDIDISRGDMIAHSDGDSDRHRGKSPQAFSDLNASVVWMGEESMKPGRQYWVRFATRQVAGSFAAIHHRVDVNTLEQQSANELQLNEIASCLLKLTQPVAVDPYADNRQTGAFIVIDRLTNATVAAGMVESAGSEQKHSGPVSTQERIHRLHQQPTLIKVSDPDRLPVLERQLFDRGLLPVVVTKQSGWDIRAEALLKAGLVVLVSTSDNIAVEYPVETVSAETSLEELLSRLQV